ncbi:MAG: hypothetical protein Q9M50_03220 [Methylococcales bacterium]|nr:hypothetical protein [Methylococcales bacterium]
MNNSKFRAIPENNNIKIPFKLEKKLLLEWLNTRLEQDSKTACLELLRLLQALNIANISSKKRITFLCIIADYLKKYINDLEGVCWDVGFPLTVDERIYAEAVTWNYLLLSEGFFIAAEDTQVKQDAAFAFVVALQAKRQAQLHIAAIYSLPTDGFWRDIYEMFHIAEKRNLLKVPVKQLNDITPETIFNKIFIFQACDTNQFRARDMQTIFYFLDMVCENIVIKVKADKEHTVFVFDLETDNPPVNCTDYHEANLIETCRYFSTVDIAHEIYDKLKKGMSWSGTLKSINTALFLRVIKTLGLGQKRKYTRLDDGHQMLGIIGFDDIVNFLRYKERPLTDGLEPKNDIQKAKIASEELKLYIKNKHIESLNSDHDDDSWQPPSTYNTKEINEINVKKIHIFDSSAKGYSVYWSDSNTKLKAKIGDVFGIISADKTRLEIALIRRIAMRTGG